MAWFAILLVMMVGLVYCLWRIQILRHRPTAQPKQALSRSRPFIAPDDDEEFLRDLAMKLKSEGGEP